jgi:hypothetical protein
MSINWLLWAGLFVGYFVLDFLCTKNVIAIQRLKPISSSNTSSLTYILGILGSYFCVTEGLLNIIPIAVGVWLGSYTVVRLEMKSMTSKLNKSKYGKSSQSTVRNDRPLREENCEGGPRVA